MGVISGMGGSVNGQNTVRQWQINHSAANQEFRASNTLKGTGRKGGYVDWTGSFTFYGAKPSVMPGEDFTFEGYGAAKASGEAIVESIQIEAPIEDGGIIHGTVNFAANGELTLDAGTAVDDSDPVTVSAVAAGAKLDNTPVADVRSWSLTISAANKPYRSSSTAGQTKRLAGPIDATASINVYTDALSSLPAVKTLAEVALGIDAVDAWDLKWMMVSSVEPTIDPESGDPVGATINLEFSGFDAAGVTGSITAPGEEAAFWPAAA